MIPLQDLGLVRETVSDGHTISARVLDLIEVIRQYHPKLDVKWIPPEFRTADESTFVIVEKGANGEEWPVFHIKDESAFDGSILEKIIKADTSRNDIMSDIDAHNAAINLMRHKANQEHADEIADKVKHVIKSPLHKYALDKDTIIRDYGNTLK